MPTPGCTRGLAASKAMDTVLVNDDQPLQAAMQDMQRIWKEPNPCAARWVEFHQMG